ncbi:hypothetical protein B0J14DRAFT_701802, partial [Halenospora varia]
MEDTFAVGCQTCTSLPYTHPKYNMRLHYHHSQLQHCISQFPRHLCITYPHKFRSRIEPLEDSSANMSQPTDEPGTMDIAEDSASLENPVEFILDKSNSCTSTYTKSHSTPDGSRRNDNQGINHRKRQRKTNATPPTKKMQEEIRAWKGKREREGEGDIAKSNSVSSVGTESQHKPAVDGEKEKALTKSARKRMRRKASFERMKERNDEAWFKYCRKKRLRKEEKARRLGDSNDAVSLVLEPSIKIPDMISDKVKFNPLTAPKASRFKSQLNRNSSNAANSTNSRLSDETSLRNASLISAVARPPLEDQWTSGRVDEAMVDTWLRDMPPSVRGHE